MAKNNWVAWVAVIALILAVIAVAVVLKNGITGNTIFGGPSVSPYSSCEYIGYADTGQLKIGEVCKESFGNRYFPELISEKRKYTMFNGRGCDSNHIMFSSESSNLIDYSNNLSIYNLGPGSAGCGSSIRENFSTSLEIYYEGIFCCK